MKITEKELEKYLKTHEWIDADATINNNMTNINVTLDQKKTQKHDKMDLILGVVIELKKDMVEVKSRLSNLESDMIEVKGRLTNLESDASQLKAEAKKHGWNV